MVNRIKQLEEEISNARTPEEVKLAHIAAPITPQGIIEVTPLQFIDFMNFRYLQEIEETPSKSKEDRIRKLVAFEIFRDYLKDVITDDMDAMLRIDLKDNITELDYEILLRRGKIARDM